MSTSLAGLIETTQLTDAELRRVLRDAGAEAGRIVRSLEGVTGPGARLRSAQAALAKVQMSMWKSVYDATKVGIGDAFDKSAELQAMFDTGVFKRAGISPAYWKMSLLQQSRNGLEAYIARKHEGRTLSDRVYRNQALSQGHVDRAVNNGLLLGKSAKEIAKDVERFIDPRTPGGASYAAMRLGRSEINNAFHTRSIEGYKSTPWVERVRWNLSGSHPRPDACNEYAEAVTRRGWAAGEWDPGEVPAKPHPNCLCYTTPINEDLDSYVKNFHAGKYDSYIDGQLGCQRSA